MRIDDATLVAGARDGAPDAISALYRRYWPLAWGWAYALTGERGRADDLAQDAVLRAFRSLRTFDEQRPFGPWLKRILLNLASDELRRLRRGELAEDWMDDWRAPSTGVEVPDELRDAVRALPPARRLVLVLHYWLDGPSLAGHTVAFQRLVDYRWRTFRTVALHEDETAHGRTFVTEFRHALPRGTRVRAALLPAQAGSCYIGGFSSAITL